MQHSVEHILREKGFRVTRSKVAVLKLLAQADRPLSIRGILALWKEGPPDQTTLYRSLTDLSEAGIVRRVDMNMRMAHYEYTPNRPHHHHLICTGCGDIEEIEGCSVKTLERKIIQESNTFIKILSHNLEFFGECTTCSSVT